MWGEPSSSNPKQSDDTKGQNDATKGTSETPSVEGQARQQACEAPLACSAGSLGYLLGKVNLLSSDGLCSDDLLVGSTTIGFSTVLTILVLTDLEN